jgi:3-oxoacyl-(acyl-carrier-protein) synthase
MEAYINGTGVISPQKTFSGATFPEEIMDYPEAGFLKCLEPVYSEYIDPMAARRMSRIVKMGVCGALKCLKDAGIDNPDAIITGTGLGCIEDTEKFLGSIYAYEEQLLNPTPFIQSTHNTVGAAIALKIKCNQYNSTYVHRGFSFESALLDGLMLIQEGSAGNVLVGGLDELTANSFTITRRLGFWKRNPMRSLSLLDSSSKGSLAGEGVAFFMLGQHKTGNSYARIKGVSTLFKPSGKINIEDHITNFILQSGMPLSDIDLIMMGFNGDQYTDSIYHHLAGQLFQRKPVVYYKHLCGEYETSSSFALYLASVLLKQQKVPETIKWSGIVPGKFRNILIYNHFREVNHSLFLLTTC